MKNLFLIIILLISKVTFSQEIFENERKLETIEKYNSEEVKITTSDEKVILFGTLITPKTSFDKILIIVSGTGKISQYAHNYLTKSLLENNIGVFRFDKRGVGKSTGYYNDLPNIYEKDFEKVIEKLRTKNSIKNKKIGALGHSLGGLITIESIKKGVKLDFLIQWSAPIGKPREILEYQLKNGIINYDKMFSDKDLESKIRVIDFVNSVVDKNLSKGTWEIWKETLKEAKKSGFKRKQFKDYVTQSTVEMAKIDNTNTYKELNIPTLVIIGRKDILVDPIESNNSLEKINNKNIEFKIFENLNHFLTKENVDENTNEIYNINEFAKKYIVDWITELK